MQMLLMRSVELPKACSLIMASVSAAERKSWRGKELTLGCEAKQVLSTATLTMLRVLLLPKPMRTRPPKLGCGTIFSKYFVMKIALTESPNTNTMSVETCCVVRWGFLISAPMLNPMMLSRTNMQFIAMSISPQVIRISFYLKPNLMPLTPIKSKYFRTLTAPTTRTIR